VQGEKWFKGMPLDTSCYMDFIKPEYRNRKIGANIPSEYLLEPFEKLLKIIRKYFTCEGRFDKVHPYHIRLLMHFTGRNPLNLPFFLCRSLGKMADSVQAKADQPENNLFHFSLIKMLVVEELGNLNKDWNSFLISENIPRDPKGDIPLSAEKSTLHSSEVRRGDVTERRKGKEMEDSSLSQPTSQKRSKLRFTDETEEIQAPSKPRTRSSARRFPIPTIQPELVECANQGIDEKKVELGEEDANTKEVKQQLKKSQHVIAQFYQENRELRRKLAEKIPETPASQSQAGQRSPTSPTGGEKNINWLKKQAKRGSRCDH
jgi:hypothetical protein